MIPIMAASEVVILIERVLEEDGLKSLVVVGVW